MVWAFDNAADLLGQIGTDVHVAGRSGDALRSAGHAEADQVLANGFRGEAQLSGDVGGGALQDFALLS